MKPGGPRKQYTSTERTRMLNVHHASVFKFHLKEIMRGSEMKDDYKPTFVANVLLKATKNSITDSQEYVDARVKEGLLEPLVADQIFRLLEAYTTRR
jgi:hypothetical protein